MSIEVMVDVDKGAELRVHKSAVQNTMPTRPREGLVHASQAAAAI